MPGKKIQKKKFLKQIQEEKKIQKNYNTLFFGLGPKGPTVAVEGCSPPKSTNVNKQNKTKNCYIFSPANSKQICN